MSSFITPGLIKRYFAGECSGAERELVENWLQANPGNLQLALDWLDNQSNEEANWVVQQVLADEKIVWQKTAEQLQNSEKQMVPNLPTATISQKAQADKANKKSYVRWAATVSGLIFVYLAGYFYKHSQEVEIKVAYGQVKQIILPDQSKVYLNGNSSIRYKTDWDQQREVWLNGEAYFKVIHQKNHQKFLVHVGNKLAVEVIGTEFNVHDRAQQTNVVLKNGKVKLNLEKEFKNTSVYLRPGELVEVKNTENNPTVNRKIMVNPEAYSSWTNRKWLLEGTTLQQILQKIEETYGVRLVVKNKALLLKKVSGSIPLPDNKADQLLQDVALLFEVNLHTKEDIVHLEEN